MKIIFLSFLKKNLLKICINLVDLEFFWYCIILKGVIYVQLKILKCRGIIDLK